MADENPFDTRRRENPQGLIDDMIATATRQGKGIHNLNLEIERLKVLLTAAGIDHTAPPPEKKKGGRKKKAVKETEQISDLSQEE